jgi:iron complex transport system ATP-binding protein
VLLQASNIVVQRSGKRLLDQVSLKLASGVLSGLIGPNGAGKSTLMSVLAGLVNPDSGHVQYQQQLLQDIPRKERGRLLSFLEQGGPIHWPVTVERLIALGRHPHLEPWASLSAQDQQAIDHVIDRTDCRALLTQEATTLSGGERTRVLLARALVNQPQILLADEPVAALDPAHQLQTMHLLRGQARHGKGTLVVLHDLSLAARFCDRVHLLHRGRIVAEGSPRDVLSSENLSAVYGIEVKRFGDDAEWIIPFRSV